MKPAFVLRLRVCILLKHDYESGMGRAYDGGVVGREPENVFFFRKELEYFFDAYSTVIFLLGNRIIGFAVYVAIATSPGVACGQRKSVQDGRKLDPESAVTNDSAAVPTDNAIDFEDSLLS